MAFFASFCEKPLFLHRNSYLLLHYPTLPTTTLHYLLLPYSTSLAEAAPTLRAASASDHLRPRPTARPPDRPPGAADAEAVREAEADAGEPQRAGLPERALQLRQVTREGGVLNGRSPRRPVV